MRSFGRLGRLGVGAVVGLGAMLATGWLGLRAQPSPFPPYPASTPVLQTVPLPAGLPGPVDRFFRATFGDHVPVVTSAVFTGRAELTFGGITFPARLRFTHNAGHDYRHYIECTWFGSPVMKVDESYLNGRTRFVLPFGTEENQPKTNLAANLGLWAESLWIPSVLATDSRLRWEAIDATTARLIVPTSTVAGGAPGDDAEDSFTVTFDPATGLITRMQTMRYRSSTDAAKIPWRTETLAWGTFNGQLIPVKSSATWLDQSKPWLVMTLEESVLNADVSDYITRSGL